MSAPHTSAPEEGLQAPLKEGLPTRRLPKSDIRGDPYKYRTLVLGLSTLFRLAIFILLPSLPTILGLRVEIATPLNSFRRLQEGLFLYKHGTDECAVYDGGLYYQPSFYIGFFSLLPPVSDWALPTNLVFILLDILCGNALIEIAVRGRDVFGRTSRSAATGFGWAPVMVGAAFLLNPFTILACLGRSTSGFTNLAILYAIQSALDGNSWTVCLYLALSSFLSLYPALLIPAILGLCFQQYKLKHRNATGTVYFLQAPIILFYYMGFIALDSFLTGPFCFIASSYDFLLTVSDLNPNIGLWWYFLTEMFDFYRAFFIAIFWVLMVGYIAGLSARFWHQPMFAIIATLSIFASFLPYPSISDTAFFMGCLGLYSHIFPSMGHPFITGAIFLYCCFLGPTFYHLWIYSGSGNANFFYAITLVWALAHTLLLRDSISAVIKDEFETDHPDLANKNIGPV